LRIFFYKTGHQLRLISQQRF